LVTWRLFRKWLPTAEGFLLMAAGILWVLSATGEKLHMIHPQAPGIFVEELLETNAAWLMLVSAVQVWRKPPADLV